MAELSRFLRATSLSIDLQGELEARLFGVVMDDPDMPGELLAALAKHFRWTEIGSGLEIRRPDLYARFLYRLSSAYGWLQRVKALKSSGPRQNWLQKSRFLGLGEETPYYAAYLVLERYDWRFGVFGVFYDRYALDTLLHDARRFGPLLGDALDPRMIEFLWRHLKRVKAHRGRPRKITILMIPVGMMVFCLALFAASRWHSTIAFTAALPAAPVTDPVEEEIRKQPKDWVSISRLIHSTEIDFSILVNGYRYVAELRYGLDVLVPDQVFHSPDNFSPVPGRPFWWSIEAPPTVRFISVQVRFKDGTLSAVHFYNVPR